MRYPTVPCNQCARESWHFRAVAPVAIIVRDGQGRAATVEWRPGRWMVETGRGRSHAGEVARSEAVRAHRRAVLKLVRLDRSIDAC